MGGTSLGADMATTLALMFGGALAAGAAPFFMRVRESQLAAVAALGAGLLIGSALAVIIPEGFHAFAGAAAHGHDHSAHDHSMHDVHDAHSGEGPPEGVAGLVLVGGFLAMLLLDHLQHAVGGRCGAPGHIHGHGHAHGAGACSSGDKQKGEPSTAGGGGGGKGKGKAAGGSKPDPASAAAAGLDDSVVSAAAECRDAAAAHPSGKAKGAASAAAAATDPANAIAGLLIHCCADGLAMGAAFLSGNARLSAIIAAAMVLHKAPMAFGLGTYLMACRWSFARARGTLLLFAATAPAATLATVALLGSLTALSSPSAVALCVLFSGGTFLYAATMHILPEVLGSSGRMTGGQLAAVAAGSLAPVALSWGHHH